MGLGRAQSTSDYEDLRNARILENQNRLRELGLQKTVLELRALGSPSTPIRSSEGPKRSYVKRVLNTSSPRRSNRLKRIAAPDEVAVCSRRRSHRLRGKLFGFSEEDGTADEAAFPRTKEAKSVRPANMPFVKIESLKSPRSAEAEAVRCSSKGRGGSYDALYGICCHFCRQKKLCGEEDCKRCGNLDVDEPCIGKTDCSVCHSTNGILCRACLKVRYGEEMEDVIADKGWMCPHCIEEKGTIPFWVCNSSVCLRKRKIAPTGIAIYRAKELGYDSVAHLLMDELQGATMKRKKEAMEI